MSQNDELPPLPIAFDYVYEWADGARQLNTSQRNGMKCRASYLVYTAEQMRDYACAAIAAQAVALEVAHKNAVFLADQLIKQTDALGQALGNSEPVAWLANYINKSGLHCVYTSSSKSLAIENDSNGTPQPLYTHPAPVRQPLTPIQIDDAYRLVWSTVPPSQRLTAFAHAIYGITAP